MVRDLVVLTLLGDTVFCVSVMMLAGLVWGWSVRKAMTMGLLSAWGAFILGAGWTLVTLICG